MRLNRPEFCYAPWSNGPVEGHVNRLKTIKRQMYGRANFDLLQLRVLHAASREQQDVTTRKAAFLMHQVCGRAKSPGIAPHAEWIKLYDQ
jgi:hypothetical protein